MTRFAKRNPPACDALARSRPRPRANATALYGRRSGPIRPAGVENDWAAPAVWYHCRPLTMSRRSKAAHDRCDHVVQRARYRGAARARRRDPAGARAQRRHDRRAPAPGRRQRRRRCATTGLCRLMVPARFGGYQTSIRTYIEVMAEVGRGCGSTAWVASLINVCAWLAALFPEQRAGRRLGRGPRRVDCRVAGAERRRRRRGRRVARDRPLAVGVGLDARAVGRVRHPHEGRARRDGRTSGCR